MLSEESLVVLHLPPSLDPMPVMARLRAAVADCSVFRSGSDADSQWVSLVRVISAATVAAHKDELLAAIADYASTVRQLRKAHLSGDALPDWSAYEHGEHCDFENQQTGQCVTVPLWSASEGTPDPGFLHEFITTSPRQRHLAALMPQGFHDAARVLDLLADQLE
jgi:hypothetical protein